MHCHPSQPQRHVSLTVNGNPAHQQVPAMMTLAELLREGLALTGTKIACNQTACGACTVVLDGQAVLACHLLAAQADGCQVQTIEGLADGLTHGMRLHPLQQAFIAHDALQCGFCTTGMLMALKAALDAGVPAEREAMAAAISGNLCRCGAYESILDAACDVAARSR